MAERFAFDGIGIDRAADRRPGPGAAPLLPDGPGARVLPFHAGMPRVRDGALHWAQGGDPALTGAAMSVFLGADGAGEVHAAALSDAEPAGGAAAFADLRGLIATLPAEEARLAATGKALLGWHATHGFCAACGAPTVPARAGWQRDCPACGAAHFPRTDPVVIMLVTRGNSVLLGRSPGWPEGMYSLLAGFMEPGETIEAAVRREVLEETGIGTGRVRYVASQPWPFPSSLMIGCTAEAAGPAEIRRDPAELEDALWLRREDLAEVFAGTHPRIRAPRRGAIAAYLLRAWLAGEVA